MNNVTIENFLFSKKFGDKKAYEMIKTAGFDGDINLEVIHSFDNLPDALYQPMLNYTATVGKYLRERFNFYKGEIK